MKSTINERMKKVGLYQKIARKKDFTSNPVDIPKGLFLQCKACLQAHYNKELEDNNYVCPTCDNHYRLSAQNRIKLVCDEGSFVQMFDDLETINFLNMPDYDTKISASKRLTGLNEAVRTGVCTIGGSKCCIGVLDSFYIMGSMGSVVGEKITRLIELAQKEDLPLIIFSASGGARMQEGIYSLMQMAKTSAALSKFDNLFISILTNPTTGGVAASFAMLGDIIIAEKDALIGFAGQRVIKQTINQELPEGFQSDSFALSHGQVDMVLHRKEIKQSLIKLIDMHKKVII